MTKSYQYESASPEGIVQLGGLSPAQLSREAFILQSRGYLSYLGPRAEIDAKKTMDYMKPAFASVLVWPESTTLYHVVSGQKGLEKLRKHWQGNHDEYTRRAEESKIRLEQLDFMLAQMELQEEEQRHGLPTQRETSPDQS